MMQVYITQYEGYFVANARTAQGALITDGTTLDELKDNFREALELFNDKNPNPVAWDDCEFVLDAQMFRHAALV